MAMDGIELEILWSNLVSATSEQARALQSAIRAAMEAVDSKCTSLR